jgi:hypothetical protein
VFREEIQDRGRQLVILLTAEEAFATSLLLPLAHEARGIHSDFVVENALLVAEGQERLVPVLR